MNLRELLTVMGASHTKIKRGCYSDLFRVDLNKKSIKNGKMTLVEDGKIIPQDIEIGEFTYHLDDDWGLDDEDFYDGVETRFNDYYNSVSNGSEYCVKCDFVAKHNDKMDYETFLHGANRNSARYELEWFVLASAMLNKIKWENDKHWFWVSKKYPQLYIYKSYLREA